MSTLPVTEYGRSPNEIYIMAQLGRAWRHFGLSASSNDEIPKRRKFMDSAYTSFGFRENDNLVNTCILIVQHL